MKHLYRVVHYIIESNIFSKKNCQKNGELSISFFINHKYRGDWGAAKVAPAPNTLFVYPHKRQENGTSPFKSLHIAVIREANY